MTMPVATKLKCACDIARVVAAAIACAAIVCFAQFADACEDHEDADASTTTSEKVASNTPAACNFDCGSNSTNSADLKTCQRLQSNCESKSRMPATAAKP